MFSPLTVLATLIVLFGPATQANPVPMPVPDGPPDPNACNPSCEFMCTKYTQHTLSISGIANYQRTASKTLKVTYDGVDVCPEERHECGSNCNFKYTCNKGWSFFLPDGPMEGPWSYDLQGLPYTRYIPDGWPELGITMEDIECDAWQCGGGLNPMTCRNCKISAERKFYTAQKTCDLPEGW
ncbi:hypothetical protein K469DRAFT_750472 [Zopfia rhizophila CBS 207.26]|uniref:Uncharacterized protein n=1 Tax=Zopfia rhizophila CBS 207.26 TaxID=1314779 RepID=A0A6A6E2W5_9PEZI|nr:hypothetical protein K469DRAFT_750472 [Zopfia rhizophila CBS 207.26]